MPKRHQGKASPRSTATNTTTPERSKSARATKWRAGQCQRATCGTGARSRRARLALEPMSDSHHRRCRQGAWHIAKVDHW